MTQPVISPDGYWMWDGLTWRPVGVHAGDGPPPPWTPLAPAQHDGKAIAALVLAVLGLLLPVLSPAAIGFWLGSRHKAKAAGRRESGVAIAGLVLGVFGCLELVPLALILWGAHLTS